MEEASNWNTYLSGIDFKFETYLVVFRIREIFKDPVPDPWIRVQTLGILPIS
jgi:hypothetical protein